MDNWKYIDDYNILPHSEFIYCDTRDFHILCTESNKEYHSRIMDSLTKHAEEWPDCEFTSSEILETLKNLETRSGGKGKWRMISTKSHPSWLKYIRFIKINKIKDGNPVYIAYSTLGSKTEILSRKLLSETIDKEFLCHI